MDFTSRVPRHRCDEELLGWKCNRHSGMYRVNYDLKNWQLISDFMRSDRYEDVPVLNRALLLDDALNLAGIGMLPYHVALEVTSYLRRESHYLPWKAALGNLGYIGRMFRLTDALASYKRFILYLIEPQLRNLNIDSHQNDSYLKTSHQKEIMRWACLTGHPACLHNATTLFKTWMVGNFNPVPQSLSTVLYCTAIEQGGLEQWKFLWTQYKTSAIAVSEKKGALKALGCSQNTDILEQYLRWSVQIGSGLKPGDSVAVFKAVASTDTGFNVAKEFLINNPDSIEKAVGPSRLVDMLKVIGTRMNQAAHLKQLEEFLSQNTQKLEPLRRTVSKVTERVRYNIQWMESNYKEIHSWLQEREKNFHYRSNADRG
ncbi:aminopeptidase N-like isoform X2 [Zootermopsis nevadensis]|uniref:aminopeptidase N-like isoform X2 n=1 Tax=Zootermopsis nevadensis TaxID=136037 RepID=UPI000B8EE654|nr:aminopeptidase N-like isoform X2 [Zootermopsis nevadensis]